MDPDDIREKLVEVLSKSSVQCIEANGGYLLAREFEVDAYDDLLNLPSFKESFSLLKKLKLEIELIEMRNEHPEKEIKLALRLLFDQMKRTGVSLANAKAIKAFIKNGIYARRWTQEQRENFDLRSKVITELVHHWCDFFVSYTNRNAVETNNDFRYLIRSVFGSSPPASEREKFNFVARIIAKYLEMNNLRGFADYKNIKCGDEIEAEVQQHCQRAIGFVQFIESESFREPIPPVRNWCYEEYQAFTEARELSQFGIGAQSRCYCLVSEADIDSLKPANLGPYGVWYGAIAGLKYVALTGLNNQRLRQKIRGIAENIVERKKEIIEAVLAA
jgi:hypothetical protein